MELSFIFLLAAVFEYMMCLDEKIERFNLSLECSVCLESAKTLYLMCEEHMTKLSMIDSDESSSKLPVTAPGNSKSASNQNRGSKKPKGSNKSNSGPGSRSQKCAEKKEGDSTPLTISDYSFSGGEALLKRLGNVNNELGKMFENKLIDVGIVRLNGNLTFSRVFFIFLFFQDIAISGLANYYQMIIIIISLIKYILTIID